MRADGRLVISVIGRKGGAGKTTTAFNLAGAYQEQGCAPLLLDLDPQESLARLFDHESKITVLSPSQGSDIQHIRCMIEGRSRVGCAQ